MRAAPVLHTVRVNSRMLYVNSKGRKASNLPQERPRAQTHIEKMQEDFPLREPAPDVGKEAQQNA